MYKIGDIFYNQESLDYYILSMFEYGKVGLINIATGNRWDLPENVNRPSKISEEEFISISSSNEYPFRKVNLKFVEIEKED